MATDEIISTQPLEQHRREVIPRTPAANASSSRVGERRNVVAMTALTGVAYGMVGTAVVVAGVLFGTSFIDRQWHPDQNPPGFIPAFSSWDGVWYARIATQGYTYNPQAPSSVAFFPAYPALCRLIMEATGLPVHLALLVVSHVCLIAACAMFAVYIRDRNHDYGLHGREHVTVVLGAFALWPITYFFRMGYTESLFFLLLVVPMYGMRRGWHPVWIALWIGAATATRLVGLALLFPLAWELWQRRSTMRQYVWQMAVLTPIACWGLVAYMVHQFVLFGDPMMFVHTQAKWARQAPLLPGDHVLSLLAWEPVWSVYVPEAQAYWGRYELPRQIPLFSMYFSNPIYFLVAVGLIGIGAARKWLDGREILLSLLLLMIPYVTQGHLTMMQSQARYAAVVFPIYLVLGRMLSRAPRVVRTGFTAGCVMFLFVYSILFVSWYRMC